ncbi:hypothetical protein ACHAWF_011266 [Thalassiosira exigua]
MRKLICWLAILASASAYSGCKPRAAPSAVAMSNPAMQSDRRTALTHVIMPAMASLTLTASRPAHSAELARSAGTLEARSTENSLAPPPYSMEASDIFYPALFQGSWKVVSRTADVIAPCGMQLFTGGQAAYDNVVQTEVKEGSALEYRARFVTQSGGDESGGGTYVAADREYNAREIAKAAMGAFSVVDTPVATPNRYSCLLAPPDGSSNLIRVDILALARKSEPSSTDKFVCSEFVRQIVSPAQRNNPNAPPVSPLSVKEIETISIYDVVGKDRIQCRQRTATFLVPSQTDPIAFKKWQLSQGRPVDIRYYDVTYTRAV